MASTSSTVRRRIGLAAAITAIAAFVLPAVGGGAADAATSSSAGAYTVYAAPTKINAGASSWFAMGVLNNGPSKLGSFRVALPPGFTPQLPFGAAITPRGLWDLSLQTCTSGSPAPCAGAGTYVIEADAHRTDGSDTLSPGEGLAFLFQATATNVGGVYPWQTAATTARLGAGSAFTPPATPRTITVISNAATSLLVTGVPGDPVAGTALSPTVTAIDAFGNVATGYRGTVHFALSSTSPSATVPADYTFTAADAGSHTFTNGVVLTQAPAQGFTVTDPANGLTSGSISVPITPADTSQITLTVPTTATLAGAQQAWTVTTRDAYNNLTTDYVGPVSFGVNGSTIDETIPDAYAFSPGDGGTHTVNATLVVAGNRTVTATPVGLPAVSKTTTVTASTATKVAVEPTGITDNTVTAGDTFDARVTITDTYGNPVTDYTGTVGFDPITDGTVPASHTYSATDLGTHLFTGFRLTKAGAPVLRASDGSLAGTAVVNVNPGSATLLTVDSAPHTVTAGEPFSVTVSARDGYGNIDTNTNSDGSLTCGDALGSGTCPTPTFTNGQATFSPTLKVAGAGQLVVGLGDYTATVDLTVVPNDPAQLVVQNQSASTIQAGQSFGLDVVVYDGYGNVATSDGTRDITLSADPGNAPFPQHATAMNGMAHFTGVTVNKAASYALTATSGTLAQGETVLGVTPAPAVGLKVGAPSSVAAGAAFDTSVSVVDTFNNVVTTDSSTQVSLNANQVSTGLPASGTVTNGSISFTNVKLKTATTTTLSATSSSNPSLTGIASVAVVAGAPASTQILSLLDQGSAPRLPHPVVGQAFDTTIGFFDSQGNPAVASGATVTLSKTTGTGTLTGITTSPVVPTGATQITIVGSVYSVLENNVTFTATTTGLSPNPTPASITVDVAGQAATVTTSVGTPTTLNSVDPYTGAPCILSATQGVCSQYILPRGGTSNIYLFQTDCVGSADTVGIICRTKGGLTAQLVNALGPLLDAQGNALYTRANPATLVVGCYTTLCPHLDKESPGEKWSLFELKEDVKANPIQMSVDLTGVPGAPASYTGVATICAKPGVIDAGKYFCIDPVLSKRDSLNNLIQYLLFVGDPKAIFRGP